MADPKHPRHYEESFKRQIVQLLSLIHISEPTRP